MEHCQYANLILLRHNSYDFRTYDRFTALQSGHKCAVCSAIKMLSRAFISAEGRLLAQAIVNALVFSTNTSRNQA